MAPLFAQPQSPAPTSVGLAASQHKLGRAVALAALTSRRLARPNGRRALLARSQAGGCPRRRL